MSMFQIGLSGLQATQTALEVTSNNIANSATSGFKTSSAEFASIYNGEQRGGVTVSNISDDFNTSGDLVSTGESLDLAITGNGFFTVSENDGLAYTQAGQFGLDEDLNIVNASGANLQGYGVDDATDPNIISGVLTDLKVEGNNIGAQATDDISFSGNFSSASDEIPYPTAPATFDPTDGSSYNFSQTSEIYDSLGNSHSLTQYYNHTGSNTWDVTYFLNGQPLTAAELAGTSGTIGTQDVEVDGTTTTAGVVTMTFDSDGELMALDGSTLADDNNSTDPFNLRKVEISLSAASFNNGAADSSISIDLTQSTQYGSGFVMYENEPNGYTAGEFSGVLVDDDGSVYATFTNGETKLQGQIVLASFANVEGLQQGNNTVYYNTTDSGEPLYGEPGSGSVGDLLTGSYMSSNVDISGELVDLLSFQQNYQANAKSITSADEMMQILFGAV